MRLISNGLVYSYYRFEITCQGRAQSSFDVWMPFNVARMLDTMLIIYVMFQMRSTSQCGLIRCEQHKIDERGKYELRKLPGCQKMNDYRPNQSQRTIAKRKNKTDKNEINSYLV